MSISAHRVFAHLTADNAAVYRAVLMAFVQTKERFRLHLRPEDLVAELADGAPEGSGLVAAEQIQPALNQLVDWGNLIATPDGSEVRTVEDFYRARFLYQLSRPGEAAETALQVFHERLEQPGELQTAALADIDRHLAALQALVSDPAADAGRVHQTISQLFARFDGLAEQARSFLASLRRSLDLRGGGVDDFLAYKEHLIGYVERFLRELTASAGGIIARLQDLERAGITVWLLRCADRDLADSLRQDAEARAAVQARWQRRFDGLRTWFIGADGQPAQYQELRAHTRAALPVLLEALGNLHDARLRRSDRVADLRCLARWFATAASDQEAHALFHQAFLLSPSRHLMIDDATVQAREDEPVPPSTPWYDDRPIRISPRLRSQGRLRAGPGQRAVVLDHGLAKIQLHRRLAEEAAALHRARAAIATGRATRLSQMQVAEPQAFEVLLDCLGAVLARRVDPQATITANSGDGSLRITCTPLPDRPQMTLPGPLGDLIGEDLELTICESWR